MVQLTLAWRYGTLANHSSTVLKGGVALVQTVEMQSCSFVAEVVDEINLDGVTNVSSDGWAWPLAIDADQGAGVTIRGSIDPSQVPVVCPRNRFWVRSGRCFCASRRGCLDRRARSKHRGSGSRGCNQRRGARGGSGCNQRRGARGSGCNQCRGARGSGTGGHA